MRAPVFFHALVIALAVLIFGSGNLHADLKEVLVEPGQTDPAIESVHGAHLAVYDPKVASRHRLFFFIAGTGAKAIGGRALESVFAEWGYHAISIDYENNVITTTFVHSMDPTSFDRYRKTIVTGAALSDKIKVDPANSILNRFQKLLVYLVAHDPQGGWDEFVTNGEPVWSRIIVGGHSQGSGHAAYIGKMFPVDRVLIFSGPQDYLNDLHEPAPWLAGESATPPSHFFALLSKNDPFNEQHQLANCSMLMHLSQPEPLAVLPNEAVQGHHQIFVNDTPKKLAHGSTLSPEYTKVWEYMATAD